MPGSAVKLLIISRATLREAENTPVLEQIYRTLAGLNRKGYRVLLTAAEPDHWEPTRGSVDQSLFGQGVIRKRLHAAGGELDGIYYVARSEMTQDRNRKGALMDILRRYYITPEQATLLSSSKPFLKIAALLGINTREIISGDSESNLLAELHGIGSRTD